MTEIASAHTPSVTPEAPAALRGERPSNRLSPAKERFGAPWSDYKLCLWFYLSMALLGLHFYPALLIVFVVMAYSWRTDRTHFLLQIFIFSAPHGAGLFSESMFPVKMCDLVLAAALVLFVIMRRGKLVNRLLCAMLLYFGVLVILSRYSVESLGVQLMGIRRYMMALVFIVPLAVFSGQNFDVKRFFQLSIVYSLVMCAFYVLDGFVFNGWVLLPATYSTGDPSTFYSLKWAPLSTYFPRKYPLGFYLVALCVYPLIYYYRLSAKQWLLVFLSFCSMRTMTVIGGLVGAYLLFQSRSRRAVLYISGAIVAFIGLYAVDVAIGGKMRISTTIDQFTILENAKDDEDLAEFGSNRMAQIMPKLDLLYENNLEWVGFGFIHAELSKNNAVQLTNELYSDVEKADENVANVEVTQIHTLLMSGYIGLVAQVALYVAIFFILKPCSLRKFYLLLVVCFSIYGLGGFGGLTQPGSLMLIGLSIGVVLLQHRQEVREQKQLNSENKLQPCI